MEYLFVGEFLVPEGKYTNGPIKVANELYRGFEKKGFHIGNIYFNKNIKSRPVRFIYFIKQAIEVLRRNKDCKVIVSGIRNEGLVLLFLKRLHIISNHIHYIAHGCVKFEQEVNGEKNSLDIFKENFFLNSSDTVSTVSDMLMKLITSSCGFKCGKKGRTSIPNGIDDKFAEHEYIDVRRDYMQGDSRKIVLFLGGFKRIKNADKLIKCFANNKEALRDFVLVIAGEKGQYYEQFKDYIKDNIVYVGKLELRYLKNFYRESSMLVMPSVFDTFGLVTLEALAFFKPVILSKNVGVIEYVNDTQNYIKVLDDTDEDGIVRAVVEVDSLIAEKKIDKGAISGLVHDFRWENIVIKYHEFISNYIKLFL